ncbi:MAG: hypothetical protein JXM69_12600 [Anaerolineae bacterium]|nr:hypothetical protein [Anaerolineae bacterium]
MYDPKQKSWVAEAGEFEVLVGSSSQDIRTRATFSLTTSGLTSDAGESASTRSALRVR